MAQNVDIKVKLRLIRNLFQTLSLSGVFLYFYFSRPELVRREAEIMDGCRNVPEERKRNCS